MRAIRAAVMATVTAGCLILGGPAVMQGRAAGKSALEQQLAAARAATARYHDPEAALADGYVDIGPIAGEGGMTDFVNFDLIDCTLDVTHPEALRYVESGQGLRLVGVEYSIPMACADTPPEDFLAGAGEWEQEPGVPAWSFAALIWSGNSIEPR